MDYRLDDNEQMVQDLCMRFAREQLAEAGAEADRAAATPPELIAKGLELGLFLDAIPEEAGGYLDGVYSHTQRAVRLLALSRGCPGVALRFEANTDFALGAARVGGDGAAVLAALADPTTALACTVLSAANRPLELVEGKLRGHVGGVPNAVGADAMLVVAGDDGQGAPFLAVVRPGPGVEVVDAGAMGLRAAAVGNVTFRDATPVAVLAGADAAAAVESVRNGMRVAAAALAVGAGERALDDAAAYAEERVQFAQSIARFQSMARLVEENRAKLAAARALTLTAAQALDHGGAARTLCRQAAAIAGEAAVQAAVDAVQVYGGYGYVNDYPVEKVMRDVRTLTTLAGDGLREQVLAAARG